MNPKSEVLTLTTPVCKFQYAWLVDPDTKFDPLGEWKLTCLIEPEESQELEEQLTGLLDRWKAQLKAAEPNKKFKLGSLPWELKEVEEGGETKPYFVIRTKLKVGGTRPDGTQWKNRPPTLFNAEGNPVQTSDRPKYNKCGIGTTGQVSLRCSGYSGGFGVGIKIQPEAVIIMNHVEYVKDAVGYGFQVQTSQEPNVKTQEATTPAVAADEF